MPHPRRDLGRDRQPAYLPRCPSAMKLIRSSPRRPQTSDAYLGRPVKRRAAVATRDAGKAAAQATAVPIFWSHVARLSAFRHDAHCLECVVHGSMAAPRSSLSRCSSSAGPKAWGGLSAIPDWRQNCRHAFAPTSEDVGVTYCLSPRSSERRTRSASCNQMSVQSWWFARAKLAACKTLARTAKHFRASCV